MSPRYNQCSRAPPTERMVGRRGGQPGNRNAQRYLPVGMPKGIDVSVREGYVRFIIHVIGRFAVGKVSGRDYGTLSQWVRMLGDVNGWIVKAPLQIYQAQAIMPSPDLQMLLSVCDQDERIFLAKIVRRLKEHQSQSGSA